MHEVSKRRSKTAQKRVVRLLQDVTMRLIAERVLPNAVGATYVDGELISLKPKQLLLPRDGHDYHVFCSNLNPGSIDLMHELAETRTFTLRVSDERRPSIEEIGQFAMEGQPQLELFIATCNADRMNQCEHMLLLLRGGASPVLRANART